MTDFGSVRARDSKLTYDGEQVEEIIEKTAHYEAGDLEHAHDGRRGGRQSHDASEKNEAWRNGSLPHSCPEA
jgi:hypothetical protein